MICSHNDSSLYVKGLQILQNKVGVDENGKPWGPKTMMDHDEVLANTIGYMQTHHGWEGEVCTIAENCSPVRTSLTATLGACSFLEDTLGTPSSYF